MRIVRTRSIPHVDDDRLTGDLEILHQRFHTPSGLYSFDGGRREMVDNGLKILAISTELQRRGYEIACRWCRPRIHSS